MRKESSGICCPQTELLDVTECFNGVQMPGWDFVHVQDGVNYALAEKLSCASMFSKKEFAIIGNLRFITCSRTNFMLS